MITLHHSSATSFDTLGLGCIDEGITDITVVEELNGQFELTMTYLIDDVHFNDIKLRSILYCKPNPYDNGQPFRIYNITTPIDRTVTVSAAHISYDMSDYPINPFTTKTAEGVLTGIRSKSVLNFPFTLTTNIKTDPNNSVELVIDKPETARSIIGNSLISYYGGELKFDNMKMDLLERRGVDRRVVVEYGKNITDLNQEINCSEVYTGVYPYWTGTEHKDDETVDIFYTLPEKVVKAPGDYNFERIMIYDASSISDVKPNETAFRTFIQEYIKENSIGVPKISITVSFLDVYSSEGYGELQELNKVLLGDTVTVRFNDANIDTSAKCIKTEYDPLNDQYISIGLGDVTSSLDTGINDVIHKVEDKVDKVEQSFDNIKQEVIDETTDLINNGLGGYVVKTRNELLIGDSESIPTMNKLWRWNVNGLGFSQNGYGGPYETALTNEGKILLNEVTVDKITSDLIQGGTLQSINGNLQMNLEEDDFTFDHNNANTKTVMDRNGLCIVDKLSGDPIAWLTSKDQWSEVYADKVFAKNIINKYVGDSNIYVDHNWTGIGDGTKDRPFNSFSRIESLLNYMIVNNDVNINVLTRGDANDRLTLKGITGTGDIWINLNKDLVLHGYNSPESGTLQFVNITNRIYLHGGRTEYNSNDGAIIDKDHYGVIFINCSYFSCSYINIDANHIALASFGSKGVCKKMDLCSSWAGVYASNMSVVYDEDSVGNCDNAYVSVYGGVMTYGGPDDGYRPMGNIYEHSGTISHVGHSKAPTPSFRLKPPTPPVQNYNKTFKYTSMATYQYMWSNWKVGECKQGSWGYGQRGGHIFFDLDEIRNFTKGTIADGSTITLTRLNGGGYSSATNVYISGSNRSGASGTPSYGDKTLLGTLKWGETKTFTLPKSIVDNLRTGIHNSLAFYSGVGDRRDYLQITNCSINIKVVK